jgi:hypothetical protein
MIVVAAFKIQDHGQSPFSAEELTVAVWKEYPRSFGLKGYAEQFPDSNRVLSSIMGERGLVKKGWLIKMGQKLYALSPDGKRMVKKILEGGSEDEPEPETPSVRLPKDLEKQLVSLLDSSARDKVGNDRAHELSFADACRFWSITDHLSAEALDAQLARVDKTLSQSERATSKGTMMVGHREVTRSDIDLLRQVDEYLQERFSRHLMLLRSRNR